MGKVHVEIERTEHAEHVFLLLLVIDRIGKGTGSGEGGRPHQFHDRYDRS